jgi:hypothetical protein
VHFYCNPRILCAAVLLLPILHSNPLIADRGDVKLCLAPGFSYLSLSSATPFAGGIAASAAVGLDDTVWAEVRIDHKQFFKNETAASLSHLDVGLVYNLDIWTAVPFMSLSLATFVVRPRASPYYFDVGPQLGIGFDYFVTKTVIVGADAHYQVLLRSKLTNFPSYVEMNLRLGLWL